MVAGGNELEGVVVVVVPGVRLGGGGRLLFVDQYHHIFHTTGRTTTISRFVQLHNPRYRKDEIETPKSHRALI